MQLRVRVWMEDGAALEAGLLHAAEPREFGGHLLWSGRPHRLLLQMNRRSRDGKEEPCYVGQREMYCTLSCSGTARPYIPSAPDSRATRRPAHFLLSLTHGLGLSLEVHDGTWKVLLATHPISISFKRRRVRRRSWFHTIHSALHAASRGSGDCSSSLLLTRCTLFEKVVVTGSPCKIHSLAPDAQYAAVAEGGMLTQPPRQGEPTLASLRC